jgi:putative sigma-54 modulation protein
MQYASHLTVPSRTNGDSVEIAIRSRKLRITKAMRATVEEKVGRLTRYLDGMERAEVWFAEEQNPRISDKEICEVTMFGHGHIVRAKAAAADPMAAVDRVVDKLEHRMEKLKGKLVGRSHPRRNALHNGSNGSQAALEDSDDDAPDDLGTRIVKTKQFDIKPMTPEEAALQMELLGHDFFFFTNAETDRAAVVYRRADANIGLIDAT